MSNYVTVSKKKHANNTETMQAIKMDYEKRFVSKVEK